LRGVKADLLQVGVRLHLRREGGVVGEGARSGRGVDAFAMLDAIEGGHRGDKRGEKRGGEQPIEGDEETNNEVIFRIESTISYFVAQELCRGYSFTLG
jgi:uncharacterized protein YcfJ